MKIEGTVTAMISEYPFNSQSEGQFRTSGKIPGLGMPAEWMKIQLILELHFLVRQSLQKRLSNYNINNVHLNALFWWEWEILINMIDGFNFRLNFK